MIGLELLLTGEFYTIQTAYNTYKNLKFMDFIVENDDVTLAKFSSVNTLDTLYFDVSLSTNQVIV